MCEKPQNHNKNGKNLRSNGFLDIGVDDLDRAQRNRERTAQYTDEEIRYYSWLDNAIGGTSFSALLPAGVPIGDMPQASRNRRQQNAEE